MEILTYKEIKAELMSLVADAVDEAMFEVPDEGAKVEFDDYNVGEARECIRDILLGTMGLL